MVTYGQVLSFGDIRLPYRFFRKLCIGGTREINLSEKPYLIFSEDTIYSFKLTGSQFSVEMLYAAVHNNSL